MDAQTNLNIDPRGLQTDDYSLDVFTPSSFYLMKGPDYCFFYFHFKKEDIFFKNVRNLRLQSQGNLTSVRRKKTFSTNILETKHGQLSIPTLNAPNDVISADVGLFAYVTTSRCMMVH